MLESWPQPGFLAAESARGSAGQQRRVLPLALALGVAATVLASSVGTSAWIWLAAWSGWASMRFVLATEAEASQDAARAERLARWLEASLLAEPVLWGVLVLALLSPARLSAGLALLMAASVLLAAFSRPTSRGWWRLYLGTWAALLIAIALAGGVGASGRLPTSAVWPGLAVLCGGWVLAAWLARPLPARVQPARNAAREGFKRALAAMPLPVLIVHRGRIVDLNAAAALEIGLRPHEIKGTPLVAHGRVESSEADALAHAGLHSARLVLHPGGAARTWQIEVSPMNPGAPDSPLMLAWLPQRTPEPAHQARHLAAWLAGQDGRPWHCDAKGRLFLPPEFAPDPVAAGSGFPLAAWLAEAASIPEVEARWRHSLAARTVFDETLRLRDAQGRIRQVRVAALARGETEAEVLGVIAAPAAPHASEMAGAARLLGRMPVLVWLVDASGRVLHAQGREPERWGLQCDPADLPPWDSAFAVLPEAREDLRSALERARRGEAVYDLLHARAGRAGARLLLRSHFFPYSLGDGPGVMVLDTVASAAEVIAIERLKQSKAQYKALVEASTSLVWACDADMRITFASRRAAREMYGREANELAGLPLAALAPARMEQPGLRMALEDLRHGKRIRDLEVVQLNRQGQHIVVAMTAAPLRSPDGRFAGAIGMNSDLTAIKQREVRLAEALRIERTVLDSAGQSIAVVKQGRVQRCNDAFLQLVGLAAGALAERPVVACFASPSAWAELQLAAEQARERDATVVRELEVRRAPGSAEGGSAWCQLTARAIGPEEYVLVMADIDAIRRREESARHDAHHDELTGLANRRLFAERADTALAALASGEGRCALLAIDLDGFKEVNDKHGHAVGDQVLREVARRLGAIVRSQDTVARRGGDEFAVLVPQVASLAELEHIAERVLRVLAQPIDLGDERWAQVTASLGLALAPDHGRDCDRLLQLADLAMYQAKLAGKNRWAIAQGQAIAKVTPLRPRATQHS